MWPFKSKKNNVPVEPTNSREPHEKTYRDLSNKVDAAERREQLNRVIIAARTFHYKYPDLNPSDFLMACDAGLYSCYIEGIRDLRLLVFDGDTCRIDIVFEEKVPGRPNDFDPLDEQIYDPDDSLDHDDEAHTFIPYAGYIQPGQFNNARDNWVRGISDDI